MINRPSAHFTIANKIQGPGLLGPGPMLSALTHIWSGSLGDRWGGKSDLLPVLPPEDPRPIYRYDLLTDAVGFPVVVNGLPTGW